MIAPADIKTALIFAMARNRAIGFQGDIPWHIPDDLKRFKTLTLGHPCVMGRKTFESIVKRLGKPLPGRASIVVSKSGYEYGDIPVFPHVAEAIEAAKLMAFAQERTEIFICGGAEIYAATLPIADRLYVTEVDMIAQGDAFMPVWDVDAFAEVTRDAHAGAPAFTFTTLERL
jgi:dihydrofolate reductase